jgi:NDP-sugar pyrophosphorylase family protein
MTVYRNSNVGEVSNVVFDGTLVTRYEKNRSQLPNDMVFVDYGLLVLSLSLIEDYLAPGVEADLSNLLQTLSEDGNLAGYEATARFHEIGSPQGLRTLERELSRSSTADRARN